MADGWDHQAGPGWGSATWGPNEILPACFWHRYASVFILDRLPAHRDRMLGPEDEESSAFLDDCLERDYRALGYRVVRVPPLAPTARMDFVLDRLPPVW